MAENFNRSSSPESPVSPPPGFPAKVSTQVRAVADSSIVAHQNDHLPQKMNSLIHQNPVGHLSLGEIKKTDTATNKVLVTDEAVKTTLHLGSTSRKTTPLINYLGIPDLNEPIVNHHPDQSLCNTKSMSQRRRRRATRKQNRPVRFVKSPEGLTNVPENPNGRGVQGRGRRTMISDKQEQARPSQQAAAYSGEEALVEVEVKWEI
ncbi:unnamed protein product [Dovyalis caffra]|uniref:Uncharacterized protein n=1 Tax=Dovyalis caffra TaxID=77055 RepID=A0AAV1RT32_9ROSI|nr:unnamed protein product [Dovyalis caffra]